MTWNTCESSLNNVSSSDLLTILCDCFIIFETVTDIIKIMACFILQVSLALFNAIAFGFGKLFVNTLYWLLWIVFHFTCGILGLEDKSTSAFSWLFLVLILFLYCDGSHHDWFIKFSRFISTCLEWRQRRLGCNNQNTFYNELVLENQRNEHREIEPINRQLEAENRENENEENNLVEADRHRVDNDNRRNMARESGVDNQRASIENRQNVERERDNTRTTLENRRNRTQEQHRYFLRQRNRNRLLQQNRLGTAQHGIGAVVLSGQSVVNMLQPNTSIAAAARNSRNGAEDSQTATFINGIEAGSAVPPDTSDGSAMPNARTVQGVPHRGDGSLPRHLQL